MNKTNFIQINNLYSRLEYKLKATHSNCEYLNFGYWKNTTSVLKACEAMVDLVLDEINPGSLTSILDAGYGYGVQDLYIANKFPNLEIHGVNIVDSQISVAKQRIDQANLSNRVHLIWGDAVKLPYKDESFDAVVAIESAFHFRFRHNFFDESFRVLKPGGKISLADFLPMDKFIMNKPFLDATHKMGIPAENQYSIDEYINRLKKSGFNSTKKQNISDYVLPYSAIDIMQEHGWRSSTDIYLNDHNDISSMLKHFMETTTIGNYYIISAIKN